MGKAVLPVAGVDNRDDLNVCRLAEGRDLGEFTGAVKRNTRAMYPEGYAVKSNREDLTFFEGGMAFEKAMDVTGGYGERVEDPAELPKALDRAATKVSDGTPAVLNLQTV